LTDLGHNIYESGMPRGVPITDDEEATIKAALTERPHAAAVARASKGAWSYATVWRVADRWNIVLTEGRKTMGQKRLTPEQRAAVLELDRANPRATQAEIAGAVGISRPSVSRIEGGRRCRGRRGLQAG
jgi:hypothetical protein